MRCCEVAAADARSVTRSRPSIQFHAPEWSPKHILRRVPGSNCRIFAGWGLISSAPGRLLTFCYPLRTSRTTPRLPKGRPAQHAADGASFSGTSDSPDT